VWLNRMSAENRTRELTNKRHYTVTVDECRARETLNVDEILVEMSPCHVEQCHAIP
jgi:hypothetical protein